MTMKLVIGLGALTLAGVLFAGTKPCEVLLPQQTRAGAATLAPGQYRVEVEGAQAIFTNILTRQSFVTPVTVRTTKLHEDAAIEVNKRDGARFVKSIDLADSDQTLQFE